MSKFSLDVTPTSFSITDEAGRDFELRVRDGKLDVEALGATYKDRDNYDTNDIVDLEFTEEQSADALAALQAWIEQL